MLATLCLSVPPPWHTLGKRRNNRLNEELAALQEQFVRSEQHHAQQMGEMMRQHMQQLSFHSEAQRQAQPAQPAQPAQQAQQVQQAPSDDSPSSDQVQPPQLPASDAPSVPGEDPATTVPQSVASDTQPNLGEEVKSVPNSTPASPTDSAADKARDQERDREKTVMATSTVHVVMGSLNARDVSSI